MANHSRQLACLALFVGVVLAALIATPAAVVDAARPLQTQLHLQYFVQLQTGIPSISPTFLPALNASFSGNFGAGVLFVLNVTKEESRTSKLLGSVRGFTVDTSFVGGDPAQGLEVALIEYDDGRYAGTLQLQGLVQPSTSAEVAIAGGTGSFRGARGYVIITLVKMDSPTSLTFHHDLHLF